MKTESLVRHGSVYAAGDLAERLIGLAMLPVYAYTLAPAEFGVLALVQILTGLGSAVFGLGMYSTLTRFYYNPPERKSGVDVLAAAWPVLLTIPLVLLVIIGALGAEFFDELMASLDFVTLVVPALIITYFNVAFIELALAAARTRQQPRAYVSVTLARAVLTAAVTSVVLLAAGGGPVGVVRSQAAVTVLVALGAAVWLSGISGPRPDVGLARRLLRFGVPLIPMSTSSWALRLQDRLILDRLSSVEALGVYSMAARVVMPLQVVLEAAFRVIQPAFSAAASDESKRLLARGYVCQYVVGGLAVTLASCVCAPPLVTLLLPDAYEVDATVVQLLLVALFLAGTFRLSTGAAVFLGGRTAVPLALTVAGVGVNAVLNLLLIPELGLTGVALASVTTFALLGVTAWRLSPLPLLLAGLGHGLGGRTLVGMAIVCAVLALEAVGETRLSVGTGLLGTALFGWAGTYWLGRAEIGRHRQEAGGTR